MESSVLVAIGTNDLMTHRIVCGVLLCQMLEHAIEHVQAMAHLVSKHRSTTGSCTLGFAPKIDQSLTATHVQLGAVKS